MLHFRPHSSSAPPIASLIHTLTTMSLANLTGPRPAPNSPPSSTSLQSHIDLLISISLYSWPALTLAVRSQWGGAASTDKRDWFAGAVSDLFEKNEIRDVEDLEEVLLQVMVDEFEVVVDDDSAFEIAQRIWKGREKILKGDLSELQAMHASWVEKKGESENPNFRRGEDEDGVETDGDDEEEEWGGFRDEEGDQEMEEAPALVRKEKVEPEVDEDGFTKVVGKMKR